jgi:hypothetical protein
VPTAGRWRVTARQKIFRRQKSHYTAPACGFWIAKFFQFYFLQTTPPARATAGALRQNKLKRLKRISVFFSEKDLRRI